MHQRTTWGYYFAQDYLACRLEQPGFKPLPFLLAHTVTCTTPCATVTPATRDSHNVHSTEKQVEGWLKNTDRCGLHGSLRPTWPVPQVNVAHDSACCPIYCTERNEVKDQQVP